MRSIPAGRPYRLPFRRQAERARRGGGQEPRHSVEIERALGRAIAGASGSPSSRPQIRPESIASARRSISFVAKTLASGAEPTPRNDRSKAAESSAESRSPRRVHEAVPLRTKRGARDRSVAPKAKRRPPQLARGMQQIEMRRERGRPDCARHAIARFKQRPIETFPIECDEHGSLGEARGQFEQHGMLFSVVAHEKLLDLKASGIPPGEADQERVCTRAARQARGSVSRKATDWGLRQRARRGRPRRSAAGSRE